MAPSSCSDEQKRSTRRSSAFIDGDRAVGERLARHGQAEILVIVLGEFRYGLTGSRHRAAFEAWLDEHLHDFDVLTESAATAVVYAGARRALRRGARAQAGRVVAA
jgi:predicted nucleic acid-binding protein